MIEDKYFSLNTEITKEEFLSAWETEENKNGHSDDFIQQRLKEHRQGVELKYFVGSLTEVGLTYLIVPHHSHGKDVSVATGGESLSQVVANYSPLLERKGHDKCLNNLSKIIRELTNEFQRQNFLELEFSLGQISNDHNLLKQGYRSHGEDRLYTQNFHRFVAYGLCVKALGFQPVKVYCFTKLAESTT